MKKNILIMAVFIAGSMFAQENINLVKSPLKWQGDSKAETVSDSSGKKYVKFKLVSSKGRYRYRAIVYQKLKAPLAGKYEISFKFKREEPNMQLIPSCRLFAANGKSRFIYNELKKNDYPQDGEWASITKTFEIPKKAKQVYFILEARNQTDSTFWVREPKIIYKGK